MSADIDEVTKKMLQDVKKKLSRNFVVAPKGTLGHMVVSRKRITKEEIDYCKVTAGAPKFFKGSTIAESDGTIWFEFEKDPPSNALQAIKKIAEKTFKVKLTNIDVRKDPGGQSDEDEDEGPDLTKDVKRAMSASAEKPWYFQMVVNGQQMAMTLRKKKIPKGEVKDLKERAGGAGKPYFGICFGEEGMLVFELPKAPLPKTNVVKRFIKAETGRSIEPMIRVGTKMPDDLAEDIAEIETDEQGIPVPPPPPPPGAAPQPKTAPPETATDSPAGIAYTKRLAALEKAYHAAVAAKTKFTERLAQLYNGAGEMAQRGEYTKATAVLDKLEEIAKAALTLKKSEGDESDAGKWKRAFAELTPDLTTVLEKKLGDAGKIRAVAAYSQEKAEAGDYKSALASLDKLRQLINEATEGGVAYQKLLTQWQGAKEAVTKQINELCRAVQSEFPEASAAVERLNSIVTNFNKGLSDRLNRAIKFPDPETRSGLHQEMLQVVGEYRSFITGDALVKDADDNPFGVNVAVRKTMVTVLDNVTTQLSG